MGQALVIGAVVGTLCGLVPLIVGLVRNQVVLAVGGFVSCVVGGAVLGLILAIPLAAVFTILIVTRSRGQRAGSGTASPAGGAGDATVAAGTATVAAGASPAGWHPDPYGGGGQRWWDGTRWTEHVAPGGQPGQPPPAQSGSGQPQAAPPASGQAQPPPPAADQPAPGPNQS